MEGAGVICLAVDILPTEFSKEVTDFLLQQRNYFV